MKIITQNWSHFCERRISYETSFNRLELIRQSEVFNLGMT